MNSPAQAKTELDELSVLFPDKIIVVRWGRFIKHPVTLRIKPFTMRQIMELRFGTMNAIEMATGKPIRWLRMILSEDFVVLHKLIEDINDWTPEKLAASLGKDKDQKPITLTRCIALLAAAGHGPTAWLDYTPAQLGIHVREAMAERVRGDGIRAAIAAEGTVAAIAAALTKDGSKVLREFVAFMTKDQTK